MIAHKPWRLACAEESSNCRKRRPHTNSYPKSGTKRCRNVGFQRSARLRIFDYCAFLRARQEICAAKIIFHVSGWQARYRLVAFACRSWFCCDRCRNFVSLRPVEPFFRQMGDRFDFDCGWGSPSGRVSHSICGSVGGAMLSGGRLFMVSRAFMGSARRQAGGFWDDYYGCCDCVTRARSIFPRRSLVRTPRNRDSSLTAPTGILTGCDPRANFCIQFTNLFAICQTMSPTTESGIPSPPPSGTQKPFHLVMFSRTSSPIVPCENTLQSAGAT